MSTLLERTGAELKRLRQDKRLSLRELSRRSGVSTRFLTELEAGRANISIARLADLAESLGKTAAAILADAERAAGVGEPGLVIALLGLRGAGKTTIGERLAEKLDLPFFELDGLILAHAGLSLEEIFALHGEDYYRRIELEVLERFLATRDRAVLATGGGIVTNTEAFRRLEERTLTVWLTADADDHWNRVVRQGDLRPMAGNPRARAELRRLLRARAPIYRRARYRIDTSRLGIDECVEALADLVARLTASRRARRVSPRARPAP